MKNFISSNHFHYLRLIKFIFFVGSIFRLAMGMEAQRTSPPTIEQLIKDIDSQIISVCLPSVQDGKKDIGMREITQSLKIVIERDYPLTPQEIEKKEKEKLDQTNRSNLESKLSRLKGLLKEYSNAYPNTDYKTSQADEIIGIEEYFTSLPTQQQLSTYYKGRIFCFFSERICNALETK